MKILNLFKTEKTIKPTTKIQNVDKTMLSKVIGGDGDEITIVKSRSNIRTN